MLGRMARLRLCGDAEERQATALPTLRCTRLQQGMAEWGRAGQA